MKRGNFALNVEGSQVYVRILYNTVPGSVYYCSCLYPFRLKICTIKLISFKVGEISVFSSYS